MIIQSKDAGIVEEEKPYHRGYYTGAFDMFHYGHLLGIQNALKYCDQLIVAVSTDEVIRDYKHREPVIPFEQRLAIVSAIKGVSIAIPQYDLYNKMGPAEMLGCDVIFSSEEYVRSNYEGREMTAKEQAGVERWEVFEAQAKESGIDVMYLPRTDNVSSTDIKSRIVEQYMLKKEEQSEGFGENEADMVSEEGIEGEVLVDSQDLNGEVVEMSQTSGIVEDLTQKFLQSQQDNNPPQIVEDNGK